MASAVKNKLGDDIENGFRYVFVFLLGAVIYNLVEVIFRGYTHWSMSVAGGSVLLIFIF